MTLIHLLTSLVHMLTSLGAHHAWASKQGADGYAVTKRFLIVACRIPSGFHGTFHCSGWIRR